MTSPTTEGISDERLAALIQSSEWWRDDVAFYRDQPVEDHRDIALALRELQRLRLSSISIEKQLSEATVERWRVNAVQEDNAQQRRVIEAQKREIERLKKFEPVCKCDPTGWNLINIPPPCNHFEWDGGDDKTKVCARCEHDEPCHAGDAHV